MTVRSVTFSKEMLSPAGLTVLDWGDWTGKPETFGEQITVPIECDDDYEHKIFHVFVYPEDRIHNHDAWFIRKRDLAALQASEVNDWWNAMAETLLDRIEQAALSVATTEEISEVPTPDYLERSKEGEE